MLRGGNPPRAGPHRALWTAGHRSYAKAVLRELEIAVWGRSPAGVVRHLIS
eukprot:gene4871-8276_t